MTVREMVHTGKVHKCVAIQAKRDVCTYIKPIYTYLTLGELRNSGVRSTVADSCTATILSLTVTTKKKRIHS